jgi:hypothetical protein
MRNPFIKAMTEMLTMVGVASTLGLMWFEQNYPEEMTLTTEDDSSKSDSSLTNEEKSIV